MKRDIRAAEGSRREDGRRKKNAIKKRGRKNRKTRGRGRRRQRLNRKQNDGERKRSNARKKNPTRQKGNGNDRNRKSRVGARTSNSSSGLNETCFSQAIFFMKLWKDTVANFKKQKSRMTKQNSTGSSKSGKKGLFAPVALRLVDIGGGNKTNMSCGGVYGNKGAAQLQNLTKTLFDCEVEVNKSW